jgi:hypothetical protein
VIPRLLSPAEAGSRLAAQVKDKWAAAICAETRGDPFPFQVPLSPNVTSGAIVERHLMDSWGDWRAEWRRLGLPTSEGAGCWLTESTLSVARGEPVGFPKTLHASDLESAVAAVSVLGSEPTRFDLARARDIAQHLHSRRAGLGPGTLKKSIALSEPDLRALLGVLDWLADHPDLSEWSVRQLPIPRVHTKWMDKRMSLIRELTGRDLQSELRKRPTAVHLTYVDPVYLAGSDRPRKHDSWTAGDSHEIPYAPHTVLVVENRDCRVFFPEVADTVVVEGGGAAATALLAEIPWVRDAERVVYWGDMDADGYAILDQFRAALPKATSIFMDVFTMNRYEEQGVSEDKDGIPLKPSRRKLGELTEEERAAYDMVATAGPARFRRIEQEKLPIQEAAAILRAI